MNFPPKKLEDIKIEFENYFLENNINYDFEFLSEENEDGNCYMVNTDYGAGIFSYGPKCEKNLLMFILKNSSVNYAIDEDLTDDQFSKIKSCSQVFNKCDFLTILSNPLQPKVKNV